MSKGKSTQTTSVELPAWQQQQMQDIYAAASGVAQQPFVPYTGPMVAGFNPDQLRQMQATRGLFETGMQYDPITGLQELAQAQAPTVGPVTGFAAPTIAETQMPGFRGLLGADIAAYQSPFQQQVIEQSMADIQRQADIARTGAQERSIRAGAFGGSRSALLEAESQRPYVEQMARTSAGLRQAGFEQAQRAAQADLARQQQLGVFGAEQAQRRAMQQAQLQQQAGLAGQDIESRMAMFAPELELRARQQQAGLLGGLGGEQMQRLGLLGGIGTQQQMLQQQALQAARGEFERALGYGPQRIGILQAGMGTPLTTTTQTGQQKTGLGDILGAGAQLWGMSLLSDIRLKDNVECVGKSKDGHNLYTWTWNKIAKALGVNTPEFGVIADEILKTNPELVHVGSDGYLMVNYGGIK